jgi:phenylacetate-CoA ligase
MILSPRQQVLRILADSKLARGKRKLAGEDQLSRQAILDLQTRLLLRVARRAVEKVPFYRKHFQEHGYRAEMITCLDSLKQFPIINRDIVKQHASSFIDDDYPPERLWKGHTSGSSGPALDLYMPRFQTSIEEAYIHSQWQRIGYKPGKTPLLSVRARPDYITDAGRIVEYDSHRNVYNASVFQLKQDTVADLVQVIHDEKIEFIHTYPSTAQYLASLLAGQSDLATQISSLKAFLLSSETLTPGTREQVTKIFGKRVWAHYGHAEHLILGGACEQADDYHLWPSYGLAQLVDEAGNEICGSGSIGELVGTTLTNPAMPLIRYRTGDYAEWSPGDCSCGREWQRIRNVIGKYGTDVLYDEAGGVYNLSLIMRVIIFLKDVYPFEYLFRYQFLQEVAGEVILMIVPKQTFTEEMEKLIKTGFEHFTENRIRIHLETVTNIPLESSGKTKLLIQRLV